MWERRSIRGCHDHADATSRGILLSGDPAIGSLGGTVGFGSTLIGTRMGAGVEIERYGGSTLTFDRLDVTSEGGSGILASSSGTLNVAGGNDRRQWRSGSRYPIHRSEHDLRIAEVDEKHGVGN